MRRLTLTLALAVSCAVLAPQAALGQALDGMWLKLKVKATGISLDNDDDSMRSKGVFRGVCFMLVDYDANSDTYGSDTACEIARNVWSLMAASPSFTRFSDDGGYAIDANAHYTNPQGQSIVGAGTHLLTPVLNRNGRLVKAKLQSYGELSSNATLEAGVSHFLGGYTVVGSSVPAGRVPSVVVALLEEHKAETPPGPSGPENKTPGPGDDAVAQEILGLVNAARAAGGACGGVPRPAVGPLKLDPSLGEAASKHALDMATNDLFSHTGSDGSSAFDRIAAAGFSGSPLGENIAAGLPTAEATMARWMASRGHCDNIMSPAFEFLGVGYALDATSTYSHYWVQTFGGS